MNFRLTAALFAGVVLLVAGLFIAALTEGESELPAGGIAGPIARAGLKEKDVTEVEILRTEPSEQKLVFRKGEGGKWEAVEPTKAKLDNFAVDAMVRDLLRAKPTIYPGLTNNLATHGLDKAAVRVTLKAGDVAASVNVGDSVLGGEQGVTFVSLGERPDRVVAVRRSELAGLFKETERTTAGKASGLTKGLPEFRARRLLGDSAGDATTLFQTIKITAGGKELELKKGADGEWSFARPADYGKADLAGASEPNPAVFTGVRPLLNALTNLQANGAADFNENPGDLSKYGLQPGSPDAVRIELIPASGPADVLVLGKPVEADGKPALPARVYAQVPGDSAVVTIPTDKRDVILKTVADPSELRNRDLFTEAQRERIDAIDLTVKGKTAQLRKVPLGAEKRWVLYGGPNDPQEANQPLATDLVAALTKPRVAVEPLSGANEGAFAPAERQAEVKLWLGGVPADAKGADGKPPAEVKLTGSPVEVVFGSKGPGVVFARRSEGGKNADFKLPEALLTAVARPRTDFLQARFTGLPVADAAVLTLTPAPGVATEVRRPDGKGEWTFALPEARKGQLADQEKTNALVGVLNTLAPVKVVNEAPTPEEAAKYGLTPPKFQASLTPAGKDAKAVVFAFGNAMEDGGYVYARQSTGPAVVTVPKVVADRLANEELRDRTLYKADPAAVTGLKIRGWKGPTGVQVVELEKKGDAWTAKSPAGFQPDAAKVAALLERLKAPRVESYAGLGKVEYGLSVDQLPEAVEFTLLRGAQPAVTLVLGGKAGEGLVYAASSAVPGEAARFRPEELRPFVEKPTSLGK